MKILSNLVNPVKQIFVNRPRQDVSVTIRPHGNLTGIAAALC